MALKEYKCPECGGALEWNSSLQKLKCPYCDSVFPVSDFEETEEEVTGQEQDFSGDGKVDQIETTSNAQDFDWETGDETFSGEEAAGMRIYTCQSCAAEIIASETLGATTCPYCGNNIVMTGQFAGELKPEYIIPFQYNKQQAKDMLEQHVKSHKFVPRIFQDENHLDEIKGVYVPFWLYDATADVDMTFNATQVRIWMAGNIQYTRTSHFKLHRGGTMKFSKVPADGSKNVPDELMESLEPFSFQQAVPFKTAYLAGYMADRYDMDAKECAAKANARMQETALNAFRHTAGGGYNSVYPAANRLAITEGRSYYALYPVWLLNTTWNDQKYTFAMNGQTGKFVGDLPLDKSAWTKRWVIMGLIIGLVIYVIMWIIRLL